MAEHTLHIRNLDHETYVILWNLRRRLKARSWADLIRKICIQFIEEVEENEWV